MKKLFDPGPAPYSPHAMAQTEHGVMTAMLMHLEMAKRFGWGNHYLGNALGALAYIDIEMSIRRAIQATNKLYGGYRVRKE